MIKKGNHTVPWIYVIVILTVKKFLESLTKKNCKRKNQIKFKIGMLITRKGNKLYVKWEDYNNHCVKSIQTQRAFSGPYFPAFGLNTKRYFVSLHIQSKCRGYGPEKTSYLDVFARSEFS